MNSAEEIPTVFCLPFAGRKGQFIFKNRILKKRNEKRLIAVSTEKLETPMFQPNHDVPPFAPHLSHITYKKMIEFSSSSNVRVYLIIIKKSFEH